MNSLIGDRQFYKRVLAVALPIMIQNGITNFVNMLDNVMVGQIGTEQMSGVAIVNQVLFVFNLCIFGAVAGAGILGAQFFGKGDYQKVKESLRFKLVSVVVLTGLGVVLFLCCDEMLINAFLHEGEAGIDMEATMAYGKEYMKYMLIGLLPFAVCQAYSGTLRETGHAAIPMYASMAAVIINLVLNYILIFGKLGFPVLGVVGAAVATGISRVAELAIVAYWAHSHSAENPYIRGLYKGFRIPLPMTKQILKVGLPLLVNELLWSMGMATITQCYSVRGLEVVAAVNISNTLWNLFIVVGIAMGNATGIIIGQILGTGDLKRARDEDRKLIAFAVFSCAAAGLVLIAASFFFPMIYNTEPEIKALASSLILVSGFALPVFGFVNTTYFTLRSGGKTVITFLFDSGFMWLVTIPVVFCTSNFTALPVVLVYILCQTTELIKAVVGAVLVKKGVWLNSMTT